MEDIKMSVYLGIDLNDRYAMVSYFQPNMEEPETLSTVAGSEIYQIPAVLAKKRNLGQWYYGEDARRMAKLGEVICIDSLLRRAVGKEQIRIQDEVYSAEELMTLFLKKLMLLPQRLGNAMRVKKLVITMEHLDREIFDVFWKIAPKLGLHNSQFMLIDHKESFYYFTMNQKKDLWMHDVFLFDYSEEAVYSYALSRNTRTTPQVITIEESSRMKFDKDRDQSFLQRLQAEFENHIVSATFLVGDGFDGGWMNKSLQFLCRGRRAFIGKNLFSKGACYAGAAIDRKEQWPYIYMGENEMKFNLSLKIRKHGAMEFYNLISAGQNWFESSGECEVILSGSPEIDFWKQLPNSREARIETLELTDIPKRPDRTTRLRIYAKPLSDERIDIQIRDLGFGEIYRGTDKVWKYIMTI